MTESTLFTPTHTVSQAFIHTVKQTSTFVQIVSPSGQPVSLASGRSGDAHERTYGIAIGAGVVAVMLIMVMIAVISCGVLRLAKVTCIHNNEV